MKKELVFVEKIEISVHDGNTEVLVNGKKIAGVTEVHFCHKACEDPQILLNFDVLSIRSRNKSS